MSNLLDILALDIFGLDILGLDILGLDILGRFPYSDVCLLQDSLASSPGPFQILSRSRGEKSGDGLGSKLRRRPEMVDSVSTSTRTASL